MFCCRSRAISAAEKVQTPVVGGTSRLVCEFFEGSHDTVEVAGVAALVRVGCQRSPPVGGVDLGWCSCPLDAQDIVVPVTSRRRHGRILTRWRWLLPVDSPPVDFDRKAWVCLLADQSPPLPGEELQLVEIHAAKRPASSVWTPSALDAAPDVLPELVVLLQAQPSITPGRGLRPRTLLELPLALPAKHLTLRLGACPASAHRRGGHLMPWRRSPRPGS
mmetsp:Transcript_127015/g.270848  ORF Transcript_127015/g.270848 Transcript_127015/m.270848 type:complete len:219 (-) Transcript_127015:282-938(-)